MKALSFVIIGFFVLIGLSNTDAAKDTNAANVVKKIDKNYYRPQDFGVSSLTVDVALPTLTRDMNAMFKAMKTKKSPKNVNIRGTLVWKNGRSIAKVFGFPKTMMGYSKSIENALKTRTDTFFSKPLSQNLKDFNLKFTGKKEITATPKSGGAYKNQIEKYVMRYDKEYKLTGFDTYTLEGRVVSNFTYKELSNGRILAEKSETEIYGNGPNMKVVNEFKYHQDRNGLYFPKEIKTTNYGHNNKNLGTQVATFKNFKVRRK